MTNNDENGLSLTLLLLYLSLCIIITGRATAGIAITQQAILRFFAPQRQHDSRFSVKFDTAEGAAGAKFHANL